MTSISGCSEKFSDPQTRGSVRIGSFEPKDQFLPPANEVCEGYVFTPVCLSVWGGVRGGGGVCMVGGHAWQGACMAGGMHGRGACVAGGMHDRGCVCVPPRHYKIWSVNACAVRILLECILVLNQMATYRTSESFSNVIQTSW